MPTFAEQFNKLFTTFRRSIWFRVAYLVLLGVIVAFMFPFTFSAGGTACLFLLLMPLLVFIVPYFTGERKGKNFLINVLPVFLIAVLLVAVLQTGASVDTPPQVLESYAPAGSLLAIDNGTVTPYKQLGPADFNFTLRVKATGGVNASQVSAYLNLTTFSGLSTSEQGFAMSPDPWRNAGNGSANGTWYYLSMPLDRAVYEFGFWANDTQGNWTATLFPLGPIAAPYADYYGLWLYFSAFYLAIPFSFYFIILFMYWYSARMRRVRSRMLDLGTAEKKAGGGEAPTKGTAEGKVSKKAAAFTCTNCGADVDETDEKCPKCGATFED